MESSGDACLRARCLNLFFAFTIRQMIFTLLLTPSRLFLRKIERERESARKTCNKKQQQTKESVQRREEEEKNGELGFTLFF